MTAEKTQIVYTLTDEAPRLATASLLPVVKLFAASAGIDVVSSDISVAGRILGQFPERLTEEQRVADNLSALGKLTLRPEANIIKQPSRSCRTRATTSPTSPRSRRRTKRRKSAPATTSASARP
jgi:isocitrate dehydrogenase